MEPLRLITDTCNRWMMILACGTLVVTMITAVLNMVLRPLNMPITGSFELMGFGSAVIASFGLGSSQAEKVHIAVDILFRRLPERFRFFMKMTGDLSCMLFFCLICYSLLRLAWNMLGSGEVSETLRIPYYPFILAVAVGFAGLCLNLFLDFLHSLYKSFSVQT